MNDESMRLTLGVTKALADIQRVRILMLLRARNRGRKAKAAFVRTRSRRHLMENA